MKLLLVRHGQTDWNLNQRFQGQTDVPLNKTGEEQAQKIAQRLSGKTIDAIYSSDLSRAIKTAETIASHHDLKITPDPRFRELAFGEWEGLTYQELKSAAPELLEKWQTDPLNSAAPEGEMLSQLAERVKSALGDLQTRHADQTILLAAHGGPIQTVLCLALGLDLSHYWQFSISSASLTEIAFYSKGAIINVLNDTSHLLPLPPGEGRGEGHP
ncbi:MAG: alpha-ribazole phosphatase [Chloroflexi bacterium]|nr:alpha-ribazole phosphatase [Chloroflexota bacterium]